MVRVNDILTASQPAIKRGGGILGGMLHVAIVSSVPADHLLLPCLCAVCAGVPWYQNYLMSAFGNLDRCIDI